MYNKNVGFCINCDNRHGCKSKTPPCLELMKGLNIKNISGKSYLLSTNMLKACKKCDFFYSCWAESEYLENIAAGL